MTQHEYRQAALARRKAIKAALAMRDDCSNWFWALSCLGREWKRAQEGR